MRSAPPSLFFFDQLGRWSAPLEAVLALLPPRSSSIPSLFPFLLGVHITGRPVPLSLSFSITGALRTLVPEQSSPLPEGGTFLLLHNESGVIG